jgi:hypothetical protein
MSVKIYCPCGQKLNINDDLLGRHVRCPKCARVLTAPQPLLNHTEINEPEDEAETKKVPPVPDQLPNPKSP